MDLPISLKDTVPHGNSRYPFAVHTTTETADGLLVLYLHWHEEAELLLITGGDVIVRINDRTFHMKEGEVAYIEPYALHACYKADSDVCSFLALVFRPEVIAPERKGPMFDTYVAPVERGELHLPDHMKHDGGWQEEVIRLVASSKDYVLTPYRESDLFLRGILFDIWARLYQHALTDIVPSNTYTKLEPAVTFVDENYRHPITVEEMAAKVNLSVSRFSTLFREYYHTSPIAYLLQYRLQQSCILLQATDMTVAEIAFSCGFENLSNFNRQFRERIGSTPTAYRNESRAIRDQQTTLQRERGRILETVTPSSATKKATSKHP